MGKGLGATEGTRVGKGLGAGRLGRKMARGWHGAGWRGADALAGAAARLRTVGHALGRPDGGAARGIWEDVEDEALLRVCYQQRLCCPLEGARAVESVGLCELAHELRDARPTNHTTSGHGPAMLARGQGLGS